MGLNPTYVSILRNIRGLLYLPPGKWNSDVVSWLRRRYRYRMLGVTPALLSEFSDRLDLLSKPPFKKLVYPSDVLRLFVERVSESIPR
ncbi:MAG: hypothetical protein DRJ37_06075, partial [Thermoprotei archaeon]